MKNLRFEGVFLHLDMRPNRIIAVLKHRRYFALGSEAYEKRKKKQRSLCRRK